MRILLTGANGFLGKRLAKDLLNEGHEVYLLVRSEKKLVDFMKKINGDDQQSRINIIEGNITDSRDLGIKDETMKQLYGEIDAIYHMAALLSFDPSDEDRTYEVNVEGTRNVLDFAISINCPKFLYVSTAYTVGEDIIGAEELYPEDQPFVNSYEKTKCIGEHVVMSYHDRLVVSILRPSIIIGDSTTGEAETGFGVYGVLKSLHLLKRKMERNADWADKKFHLMIDPEVRTNLVPVDYVTTVLRAALYHCQNKDILNITNPEPPKQGTILQIMKEILELPNIETIPMGGYHQLRDDERLLNEPLSVFTSYFSRTIYFPCENTRRILEKSGRSLLKMDDIMLKFILSRYEKIKTPV